MALRVAATLLGAAVFVSAQTRTPFFCLHSLAVPSVFLRLFCVHMLQLPSAAPARNGFNVGYEPGGSEAVSNGVVNKATGRFQSLVSIYNEYLLLYLSLNVVLGAPSTQSYSASLYNNQSNIFTSSITMNAQGAVTTTHGIQMRIKFACAQGVGGIDIDMLTITFPTGNYRPLLLAIQKNCSSGTVFSSALCRSSSFCRAHARPYVLIAYTAACLSCGPLLRLSPAQVHWTASTSRPTRRLETWKVMSLSMA
jgi:hypothetical protein